jgi:hypothetical protein
MAHPATRKFGQYTTLMNLPGNDRLTPVSDHSIRGIVLAHTAGLAISVPGIVNLYGSAQSRSNWA